MARFTQADTLVPDPGNPQALNRYAYVYGNPVRFIDPSGHDPWRVERARTHAGTYGVPWQIAAGLQDAEIGLDTQPKDYLETFFWLTAVPCSRLGSPLVHGLSSVAINGVLAARSDPGPGVGNIHLSTARSVSTYYAEKYPGDASMQLGFGNLADDELAFVLSLPNESTRVLTAYVRMLADYRFGNNGDPNLEKHSDMDDWTLADAVAVWHGYRYGLEDVSPGAEGFGRLQFQDRNLSLEMTVEQAEGTDKERSMMGSVPYFERYIGR